MEEVREAAGVRALILAHPNEPAEPPKARRARRPRASGKPAHWPPSPLLEVQMRAAHDGLSDAREAAGWPACRWLPTTPVDRRRHGALALRLHELAAEGEADPVSVLVAVFRAKVEQQRRKDGDHATGAYATAKSICSGEWWDGNLAAGRAWLAGHRPTPRRGAAGGIVGSSFRRKEET